MTETEAGNLTTPTVIALRDWYGIPASFAHAALETFLGADYDRTIGDVPRFLDRYSRLRIQLEYTLSANWRGRDLLRILNNWGVPLEPVAQGAKKYLDIGSAYGGLLIALENLGYDAFGIELSEKYGGLGKLNLRDSGSKATMWMGDFLSEDPISGERQFDLITCIDVIEHVADPAACLQKICRLLRPGGTAYVAYPSKLSIPNVRSDVHWQRFGLTLLDHFRAHAAFTMYTGNTVYTVSEFFDPEWHVNLARASGVEAEVVYDDSVMPSDAPGAIGALYAAFSEWAKSESQKLDRLMRHEMTLELARYSARMFQAYAEHIAHNSLNQFARRWIDPLSRILIRKPAL